MHLLFIRHGKTIPNTPATFDAEKGCPNPPLSEVGIHQAQQLGLRLRDQNISRIYASDLQRATQTAEILNQSLTCPLVIRPGLREIDMGRLFTTTWDEIRQQDPAFVDAWLSHTADLPYPDGENGADLLKRTMAVVEEITAGPDERVAIVTHGGNIRVMVCAVLGAGLEKRFLVGDPLENCSITTIHFDPKTRTFTLHAVNDAAHLLAAF